MKKPSRTHLVLFFTRGLSLRSWDEAGLLEREVELYRRLRPYLGGITFVTYGDKRDLDYASSLPGISIVCNDKNRLLDKYIRSLIRRHKRFLEEPCIVKTNQTLGGETALEAAGCWGARLVARSGYFLSDHLANDFGENSANVQSARRTERDLFGTAHQVVTTTRAIADQYQREYLVPLEKIEVIPNYVRTDVFEPRPDIRPVPGRICYVGRDAPQKNLSALFEAVRGLSVKLVLIGGAGRSDELRRLAGEYRLDVEFKDHLPHLELPVELARSEIFILPSLWEGHPKVLLEAMSCGRPVIGTNAPGIREIIDHRENGFLCEPDPASIRRSLNEVLADRALQKHMAQNARRYIVENCGLDIVLEKELAMLSRVAEMPGFAVPVPSLARRLANWGKGLAAGLIRGDASRPRIERKASLMAAEAEKYIQGLPPDDGLRFLFLLENHLYPFLGRLSVEYGQGEHTKHKHMRYHDFFVDRIRPGERVLDIGCGPGNLTYDLADRAGADVVGIDLNADYIARARSDYAHPKVRYILGDACLALPGERFDVVVMSNVLEHLEHRPGFIKKVAKTSGASRWLIRVPVFERHWSVPLKRELGLDYRLDKTHHIEYTLESFRDEMDLAGLRIVHQEVRWGEIWAELTSLPGMEDA